MVRVDSQKHIDFALNSLFGGGREGRVKRRNAKVCLLSCVLPSLIMQHNARHATHAIQR